MNSETTMKSESVKPLTPYEVWMVSSNMKTIESGKQSASEIIAILRSGGYDRVANGVEQTLRIERLAGTDIKPA